MALVKFGGGVAAYSGKIEGTVYARNKAGSYARNWAKPTTTPTPAQSAVRAQFGGQSTQWNAITNAQRLSWNAAAALLTRFNKLGEAYVPTGRQIFIETNQNLAQIGAAPNADPPASFEAPDILETTTVNLPATAGVLTAVEIPVAPTDSNTSLVVEGSPPTKAGVKTNLTTEYRQVFTTAGGVGSIDLLAQYTARFGGSVTPGQQIFFRLHGVNDVSGVASPYLIVIGTVTGT